MKVAVFVILGLTALASLMIMRHYGHLTDEHLRQEMERRAPAYKIPPVGGAPAADVISIKRRARRK